MVTELRIRDAECSAINRTSISLPTRLSAMQQRQQNNVRTGGKGGVF